jgi:hypothetical protein
LRVAVGGPAIVGWPATDFDASALLALPIVALPLLTTDVVVVAVCDSLASDSSPLLFAGEAAGVVADPEGSGSFDT